MSLTGRYVVLAKSYLNSRKLYFEEVNARGGLLGHKVELKILDDKSDARTAIELYEKLITVDKVDLVMGPYSSYLTDPVANVMERYERPFIPIAASPVIYQRGRKYIFSNLIPIAQDFQKGALPPQESRSREARPAAPEGHLAASHSDTDGQSR